MFNWQPNGVSKKQGSQEPIGLHFKGIIMANKSTKIGRDARTGEFIPVKEALRRPSTTVIETIKRSPPPQKSKKK